LDQPHLYDIHFEPFDNQRLARLRGKNDENIRHVENALDVSISNRGNHFQISGNQDSVQAASKILNDLYLHTTSNDCLTPAQVHLYVRDEAQQTVPSAEQKVNSVVQAVSIHTKAGLIRGHTHNQRKFLENILHYDINFSIGPAGTGKTYLAVASAIDALEKNKVQRILLVRPAVEAGEKLGFLPGDLSQKIEPYLRPLYDALFEMIGFERVGKLIEQNIIEVAPLAYMRGRTLNDAFIILDESQNTTTEQMKMFLTRIGFGSKAIITGDITQVDLPRDKKSGLAEAIEILSDIQGICFTFFDSKDVVRHTLVQQIIEAYEKYTKKSPAGR
jgi:phosphate starvation-inducible PhoH-like protein